MLRVVLQGAELTGFTSAGFDDHVKLFFPSPPAADWVSRDPSAQPSAAVDLSAMRDFTPRHFDAGTGELWIDFFIHDSGPAASWALHAAVGDTIVVGGPKGSAVIAPEGIDTHVLIGDETALPAISRRLDELPADSSAIVVVEVDTLEWPSFRSRAALEVVWVTRTPGEAATSDQLIDKLRKLTFPPGRCHVWVALESQSARAVRRYLREERLIGQEWIKAAAYWRRGAVGVHERIEDDG
jgi:NADPH-dependent ferric siderophore reductase